MAVTFRRREAGKYIAVKDGKTVAEIAKVETPGQNNRHVHPYWFTALVDGIGARYDATYTYTLKSAKKWVVSSVGASAG